MMTDGISIEQFQKQLFSIPHTNTFAVLDGASNPLLLKKFLEHEPNFYCLLWGWDNLPPKLIAAAPYVVQLHKDTEFTKWVFSGFGEHWGIFAVSGADLRTMRTHFREFLRVQDEQGKNLLFRFYDPRVFRVFLPTCNAEEKKRIFGPILFYLIENKAKNTFIYFSR